MNRNVESHFSRIPTISHPRSSFDRSCGHSTSFNAGDIIPIYADEVLPGDTVSMSTSAIVRLQTLLTPVFGNVYLDTYWFFVPNRLTWTHWKAFMGENQQSAWAPETTYRVPCLSSPLGHTGSSSGSPGDSKYFVFPKGSLGDYFGLRSINSFSASLPGSPISLPLRAYCLIWNDFFRDQNLLDPLLVHIDDLNSSWDYGYNNPSGPPSRSLYNLSDAQAGAWPLPACKYHDYFTSCLPAPQKGPSVGVSLTQGAIPVVAAQIHGFGYNWPSGVGPSNRHIGMMLQSDPITSGSEGASFGIASQLSQPAPKTRASQDVTGGSVVTSGGRRYIAPDNIADGCFSSSPINLWADPRFGSSASIGINELRLAVVTQMYYEALARGGSRYEEQLQQFFGVRNPDSRIQHPEYLGGRRMQINIHEITNVAQSEQDFLGDVGAQSVTAGTNSDFTKSFTEHGWLLGLAVVRYEHSYHQGFNRKWTRHDKFDYYNPLFARIGEQPVYDYELYADDSSLSSGSVFGYQEAWASYRYSPNVVSGEIRPSESLGYWSLTDNYSKKPTLSGEWICEDKDMLDRVLAVKSTVSDQVFGDFYFQTTWTRAMPMYSVPGAIGQF